MRATDIAQGEQTQKRRRLSVAAQRWEQYKTTADRLAQKHAQLSHDIYHTAHAPEVTRGHLCTLHAYYANTLTAKTDYHMLVTKLVKEQMAAQRLHNTNTHMCQVRRRWYVWGQRVSALGFGQTKSCETKIGLPPSVVYVVPWWVWRRRGTVE